MGKNRKKADPSTTSVISSQVKEGKSETVSELLPDSPPQITEPPSEPPPELPEVIKPRVIYDSGPCATCNIPLQKGCIIIAVIGIGLGLILFGCGVGFYLADFKIQDNTTNSSSTTKFFKNELADAIDASGVISIIRGGYYIILFITLGIAASKRHRCLCKAWVAIYISIDVLSLILGIYTGVQYRYTAIILLPFVTIILEIYFMWVVIAFIEELNVVGVMGGTPAIANREIFDADMFTMGIYGPGTESGEQVPVPKYYPKIQVHQEDSYKSLTVDTGHPVVMHQPHPHHHHHLANLSRP